MSNFLTHCLDHPVNSVASRFQDEVVGGSVFILGDAETALEAGDAVKAVMNISLLDDAPEIIALSSPLAGVAHSLHVQKRRARILSTKLGRNAVMIRGFIAIKNHKVLSEDLALILSSIEDSFAMLAEGSELLIK